MQKLVRVLVAVAVICAGIWAWQTFFPGPERLIRSKLAKLAKTASFESTEGIVPRSLRAGTIYEFFTTDAEVTLEGRGFPPQHFSGRDDLREAALAAANGVTSLKVEFVDITVSFAEDRQSALVHLTGQAAYTLAGEKDSIVIELKLTMKLVEGAWLIARIETVKTLARGPNRVPAIS